MRKENCFYCYQLLTKGETNFHVRCSREMFGTSEPPSLEYSNAEMLKLAEKVILNQQVVTGVQAKLSLGLTGPKTSKTPRKLTIMGVWGGFILKPPSEHYPNLPELEDLTMQLAKLAGLATVPHTLIPLASGELSYLTRRIDRKDKQKFHMEDMCQLTERMTEAKYRGSYEQIAKAITKYSERPLLDLTRFYEVVLYCFLTGNNDMHLKNFSMVRADDDKYQLSPAYDLVAAELVVEDDDEEMALTLNGKKKRLKRKDFIVAMRSAKLTDKSIENIFQRFSKVKSQWMQMIDASFLPKEMKTAYQEMILKKMHQLDYLPLPAQPTTDKG